MNLNLGDLFIYWAAFCVNFISFTTGSSYSWTSPVLPKLNTANDENPLPAPTTTFQDSWITSLINVGAAVAPLAAGLMSEKIGRKKTLVVFSLSMLLSHVICIFANRVQMFYVARFMLGLGSGCVFSVLPNYVAEISKDENRGLMGCIMGLMIASGILYNYLVGPFVSIQLLSITSLIPIVLFLICFGIFVPESPYYFISINDKENAEKSLMKFRNRSNSGVQKELMYIKKLVEEAKNSKDSFKDMFKSKAVVKGLIISCGLMLFQQFSGIGAVLGYMQTIFDSTGSNIPPEYSTMLVGTIQLVTSITTSQLIDRVGRRILILISTLGSALALCSMGVYFYLSDNKYNVSSITWLPILSLLGYIILYNLALGPLPWAVMGELFPVNVKSLASTITTCFCLILTFIVTIIFPLISAAFAFWLFSFFCILGFVFTIFIIPETKGKSLEEIQRILSNEACDKF